MKAIIRKIILVVIGLIINEFSFAQCSMCRAVVESDISGKGSGINNGIVYLMAFPYALVALIAVGLVYKMRKDSAQNTIPQ
ncbi:MAG: hypothetical protein ACPGRC_08820 [Salibacteraceae bacterium]